MVGKLTKQHYNVKTLDDIAYLVEAVPVCVQD